MASNGAVADPVVAACLADPFVAAYLRKRELSRLAREGWFDGRTGVRTARRASDRQWRRVDARPSRIDRRSLFVRWTRSGRASSARRPERKRTLRTRRTRNRATRRGPPSAGDDSESDLAARGGGA